MQLYFPKNINLRKFGDVSFKIGIVLLPSAISIAGLFLLFSSLIGIYISKENLIKDKWNIATFISIIFLLIICIFQNTSINLPVKNYYALNWIGLLNWIPLFLLFWGSQSYLNYEKERKNIGLLLIVGSFPVLISGFGQYFLNWTGPFSTLNGLIVWFVKPIIPDSENASLSGLFPNPNYMGCWLTILWPFTVVTFLDRTKNIFKKSISTFFVISVLISILLTASRNAYGGLLLAIPLLVGRNSLFFLIPITFLTFFVSSSNFVIGNPHLSENYALNSILSKINRLREIGNDPRINIWINTLIMISQKPILGWGAGTFGIVYSMKFLSEANHAHNLFLELSYNYGLIVSIFIFSIIISLISLSFIKVFYKTNQDNLLNIKNNLYEKAWWTSFFILFASQLIDVQYYDGKISIIFWILLAGIINIMKESKSEY